MIVFVGNGLPRRRARLEGPMDAVLDRIDGWERAGLIDEATAARLRAAESERAADEPAPVGAAMPDADADARAGRRDRSGHLALSSIFGPSVTVGEMFAYLGAGFLLGAWSAAVIRLAGEGATGTTVGLGSLAAAGVLTALGLFLRSGDGRRRRAAGVVLLVATAYVAGAAAAFVSGPELDFSVRPVIIAAASLGAAAVYRMMHAALLTELGLIATITGFGAAVLGWVQAVINPPSDSGLFGESTPANPDAIMVLVVSAAGWLLVALVIGLLALGEERSAPDELDDPDENAAARRRATLTRAWAGLVAVLGLVNAMTQRDYTSEEFGRVIEPWIGDLLILGLAIILVERAFRRDFGRLPVRGRCRVHRGADRLQLHVPHDEHGGRVAGRGRDPARRRVRGRPPAAPPVGWCATGPVGRGRGRTGG